MTKLERAVFDNEVENVHDRATINFPRAMIGEEVINYFLPFIAEGVPCYINYNQNIFGKINQGHPFHDQVYPVIHTRDFGEISCSLHTRDKDLHCMSGANFTRDFNSIGFPVYKGMAFFATPGYSIEEINKSEIALWDKVRETAEKYFKGTSPISRD
ncbi:MAG: hypothetical protein AABY22_17555 [Nanoarchaeota archaeon]